MKSHKRLLVKLASVVVLMFGFGFALVPIYNVMCKTLGINGKTSGTATVNHTHIDKSRTITVEFLANNNSNLPWEFYPKTKRVRFHPGENARIAFYARNTSGHTMTVQAIPSVTPGIAAQYLKKTECFCFSQQTLKTHEAMDMPVLFHIEPELPSDIRTITLSYTLFDISNK